MGVERISISIYASSKRLTLTPALGHLDPLEEWCLPSERNKKSRRDGKGFSIQTNVYHRCITGMRWQKSTKMSLKKSTMLWKKRKKQKRRQLRKRGQRQQQKPQKRRLELKRRRVSRKM